MDDDRLSDAMNQRIMKWRIAKIAGIALSLAAAVVLSYWSSSHHHATTLAAKRVDFMAIRQSASATAATQYLSFGGDYVRSLKRIVLVSPGSAGEGAERKEEVVWEATAAMPQIELVTPAIKEGWLHVSVRPGAGDDREGPEDRMDVYVTPINDEPWILRDAGDGTDRPVAFEPTKIPPKDSLCFESRASARQGQLAIFAGLHASQVVGSGLQAEVFPFMPADDGKESCPGDKIQLGGDDLEIPMLAVGELASSGPVLRVGVVTDGYSTVRARGRDCLGIYRRRLWYRLGAAATAAISFLIALVRFARESRKSLPEDSPP